MMGENLPRLPEIAAADFFAVEIRAGVVVQAAVFAEARKPAYKISVDFGAPYGVLTTSAQVTVRYTPETLVGRQVLGWVNAPAKQIGPLMSQFLLLGVHDAEGAVVLVTPERVVPVGGRLC